MNGASRTKLNELPGKIAFGAVAAVMTVLGWAIEPIQRLIGVRRMAWVFLLPNLAIFGVFILFPMAMNFYYAFTGGTQLYPQNRPFVGTQNFEQIYTCTNYLEPSSCREDLFWRAVFNSGTFVAFHVVGLVFFALVTALVLNAKIRFRGFFRSVYFYPVLLSPVVVALVWKWILQRNGLVNGILVSLGLARVLFLLNADWAMFWVIFVTIWASMGFRPVVVLAGLKSIPGELYEAAHVDGRGRVGADRHITLPGLI